MSPAIRTKSAPPMPGSTCSLSDAPVGSTVTVVGIDTLTATVVRRGPGAVDVRLTSAPHNGDWRPCVAEWHLPLPDGRFGQ
jgi:hypothetical protein